jgi:hypothetical protein
VQNKDKDWLPGLCLRPCKLCGTYGSIPRNFGFQGKVGFMDLELINRRIYFALRDNRRAEIIIIGLSIGIFCIGVGALVIGYFAKNPYIAGGGAISGSFLYGPIRQIAKLRRDNLVLQVTPTMIAGLPRDQLIAETKKLLSHLRGGQK